MWKRIKETLDQTIVQLLAGCVVFVIGLIFARVAALPAYQILLLLLVLISFTFWGINQIDIVRERSKKKLTKLSDKQLEDTIHKWIDVPAFKLQRLETIPDVYFGFEVTMGSWTIHVERQRKDPMVIVLGGELQMKPGKTQMSQANWERLGRQLSIEMARLGIQFSFKGSLNLWERIRVIEAVILDDAMTGFYFRQRIMFVARAMLLGSAIFKEFLTEISEKPAPNEERSQLG